jgi:predicted transcriptional regulator of viral defense system
MFKFHSFSYPFRVTKKPSYGKILNKLGQAFRSRDAELLGLPRTALKALLAEGRLEKVERGLYRVVQADITENATLIQAYRKVPNGIICLLSALQLYDIGTQLPHEIWIAIGNKARAPKTESLPIRIVRFSGVSESTGIRTVTLDGLPVRVTNPARTVVDCFRYRNKIGLDVALEALREAVRGKKATFSEIRRIAAVCRAERVMAPYMESLEQ